MGLVAKKKKSVPPMEAGTYVSLCVGIVDLGEQYNTAFKKYDNRVMLIFEIPSKTIEVDGELKPRWQSIEVSPSLNEKSKLYQILTSWRGKKLSTEEMEQGFYMKSMLGLGCMLQIIVEDKESGSYNKITSVIGLPEGMPQPTTSTELIVFDMDQWNDDALAQLPEWIQEKIKKSTEYQKIYAKPEEVDIPDNKPAVTTTPPASNTTAPASKGVCPI